MVSIVVIKRANTESNWVGVGGCFSRFLRFGEATDRTYNDDINDDNGPGADERRQNFEHKRENTLRKLSEIYRKQNHTFLLNGDIEEEAGRGR